MEEQQPEPKSQRDSGLSAAAAAAAPGGLGLSLSPGASGSSGSDGDSVPVSPQPVPPSPPAAPCLPPLAHHAHLPPPPPPPHLAAPAHQPQPAAQLHRTTNFFIDNILRPDFGCKKEQPPPQLLVAAAAGGGGGGRVERDRGQTGAGRDPVHPLGTRAAGAASLLCASDANCGSPDGSPPGAAGGAGATKAGNPAATAAAAAAAVAAAAAAATAKPSDSGGGSGGGVGSPGGQGAKYPEHGNPAILLMGAANGGPVVKTDSQQPLVWPAWVYCTRYSDRPSSGEYLARGCASPYSPADAPELLAAVLGKANSVGSKQCWELSSLTPASSCSALIPVITECAPRSALLASAATARKATVHDTSWKLSLHPSVLNSKLFGCSLCSTCIIIIRETQSVTGSPPSPPGKGVFRAGGKMGLVTGVSLQSRHPGLAEAKSQQGFDQ